MANVFRTSIAARTTAVILLLVGLVGLGFLAVAIPLAGQQESAKQQAQLNELLETVQRTVSIACYLGDKQLADEVAQGLLSNRTVSEVTIRVRGAQLVRRNKAGVTDPATVAPSQSSSATLVRKVVSPFNSTETVGEIALVPDAAEIRSNVLRATLFTSLLLIVQVGFIGLGVVAVVRHFVTRPISGISARLHELRAETGQKLVVPRGNETDEIGQLVNDVNTMVDYLVNILNEERGLRVQIEIEEKKFHAIFEYAQTGIFLIDESGLLISYNRAFAQFFGVAQSAAYKDTLPLFVALVGEHREAVQALISRTISANASVERDIKLEGKPGTPIRWVNVVLSPIEDQRLQGVVNDITERKRAEDAAQELAATDPLTRLGNRLAFERKLEQMMDETYRDPNHHFTLLMIDLDWFKQVNDTYGHKAGDEVLIQVARVLEMAVRKTDFVGRLGGDEFVVLLASASRREIVELIIEKIIHGIRQPIAIGEGNSAKIGASVGAAVFDGEAMTKEALIRRADEAMYSAKEAGRNAYRFFEGRVGA
ncbi:MAG: diguanylate cyclase [Betaproteobacteria bacterium]